MEESIIFSGFGGQGILFAGKLIAYSGMTEDKEVSWIPSYGPEMRGGTANCSVKISDMPVSSPVVSEPDYLVAMNTPSYSKFIGNVRPGGKVFLDSSMIDLKCERDDIECFYVPASQLAHEKGTDGMANIILCGKLVKETQIIMTESVRTALRKIIPEKAKYLVELNLEAFSAGFDYRD